MKWVTHYVWAALPLLFAYPCRYISLIATYAVMATAIADVFAHTGHPPRRTRWHDPWAVAAHSLVAAGVAWPGGPLWASWMALGALGGLTHVFLDWLTPGRRAISWEYNAPALLLGLILAYVACAHHV